MPESYYANTDILAGEKSAKFGDSVSADKLGLSKDQFQQLVDSGAVGTEKPEEVAPTGTTIGATATVEELEEAKVSQPATATRSAS